MKTARRSSLTAPAIGSGPLRRFYLPHSLGIFYAALTQFLGYRANSDEYKVMGLASYGQPAFAETFARMVRFEQGRLRNDSSWFAFHLGSDNCYSHRFIDTFGPACPDEHHVDAEPYKNLAASGQKLTEDLMEQMASWCRAETGEENLCLAGGVALNAVANGRLLDRQIFKRIWVQPAASDAGCSLGIPFHIWHERLGHPQTVRDGARLLGTGVPRIGHSTRHRGPRPHRTSCRRCRAPGGALLADGKVIGWYQGRMEWGPRALGNRSILADPRRADMKHIINSKVKFREPYRPFAPSVLEEDAPRFFHIAAEAPFMTLVCRVRDEVKDTIPAVTHVDGTARIQTISRTHNPRYWTLVDEFKTLTGVPVVLNTSFNVRGEPIVCTPDEAVRCFLKTDIDCLVIGDYLCTR